MKYIRQTAHRAVIVCDKQLSTLERITGLQRGLLFICFLVVFTLLSMTTIVMLLLPKNDSYGKEVKTYKAEIMASYDVGNPVLIPGYSEDDTEEVYAGRYDNVANSSYDMMGMPTDRKWLTGKEWRGEHVTDPAQRSRFKMWKALHMREFIDYAMHLAEEEVKVYPDIPKELIVAQAIIESNFGMSRLSVEGNNLFGHKCHNCTGKYLVAHDDSPTDRFQIKKTKWHSVRAHSKLLMGMYRKRIKGKPTLKKWYKALCGCETVKGSDRFVKKGNRVYATSCFKKPGYIAKLKKIIKLYKLNQQ